MVDKLNKSPQKLEEKVLKAIFANNDSLVDIITTVTPEMFSVPDYGAIYSAMIGLYKENKEITDETVQLYLEKQKIDINISSLKKLFNEGFTSTKVKSTAEDLSAIYQRRFILENVRNVLNDEDECPTTANDLLDRLNNISLKANEVLSNKSETVKCCADKNKFMTDIQLKLSGRYEDTGLKTGFTTIDDKLDGLKRGNLWTICADSQVGKSMFALELTLNTCEHNPDIHALYYSLEMTKEEQETRGIGMVTGIEPDKIDNPKKYFLEYDDITGEILDYSKDENMINEYTNKVRNGLDKINSLNLFIDDTPDHTIQTLEASVRKHYLKYGRVDLIVVDHMNILCSGTVSEEVGKLKEGYATLKKLAKKFDCVVICLHQFNNELKTDEMRKPNIFNLIGGAAPRHFSDVIVGIWRPGIYREVVEKFPQLKDYCDLTWQKVRSKCKPDPTPMNYNGFIFTEKTPEELRGDMLNGEVYLNDSGELVIPEG